MDWLSLAIGAVGGLLKGVAGVFQRNKEVTRLGKERAEDLAQLDKEWEIAQKEAKEQADKLQLEADRLKEDSLETDALTDISENIISQTFNAAIDDISMQEKQNATQLQNEMIGTEAGLANMEVASGASGIRAGSGTNSEVIAQQKDLAQRNREQEQIMIDQSFQNNLMQVGLNLQQNKIDVRGNRFNANRMMENSTLTSQQSTNLRTSYSEGGDQYQLYQMGREDMLSDYENSIKNVSPDVWSFLSDMFTGFNSSYSSSVNIVDSYYKFKKPNEESNYLLK